MKAEYDRNEREIESVVSKYDSEYLPIDRLPSDQKLDRIYNVLNHIRWIGLGIGFMFALTFIVPQFASG